MKRKAKKELGALIRASVAKEMAKPRTAHSVREVEEHLAAGRIAQSKARKYKVKSLLLAQPQGACT
jgi:hypothetical protein